MQDHTKLKVIDSYHVYMVHNMHTIETRSNYKQHEENMYKERLLSVAIISPMRKPQKNYKRFLSLEMSVGSFCLNDDGLNDMLNV